MSTLTGKVAVITGASRGIGRALALGLAGDGCAIVIAAKSVTSTEKLPGSIYTVAQEVEALGAEALPVPVDRATPSRSRLRCDEPIRAHRHPDQQRRALCGSRCSTLPRSVSTWYSA